MKNVFWVLIMVIGLSVAVPTFGTEFAFHGDLNHRFKYTNHADFAASDQKGVVNDGAVSDFYGEIKYRMWAEAETEDKAVKGVFATEIGGLRFGEESKATYSGDSVSLETRWAFIDFQLPMTERLSRFKVGLQPFALNPFVWVETAAGIAFRSEASVFDYQLGWMRGYEVDKKTSDEDDERSDVDALFTRFDLNTLDASKLGVFGLVQTFNADAQDTAGFGAVTSQDYEIKNFKNTVGLNLVTFGVDGRFSKNHFVLNWDLIYQIGKIEDAAFTDSASGEGKSGDFDVSAYLAHIDIGYHIGKNQLVYRFWYASGDDDATDGDFNAFLSTDVDRNDSIALMEGNYADDDYFTERPYILDKGFIMNKLDYKYKFSKKLTAGAAVLYMLTAEDIEYTDSQGDSQSQNELGIELDAFTEYALYDSLVLSLNAGYLFSGDAMDYYEVGDLQDGSADEDIFVISCRARYRF